MKKTVPLLVSLLLLSSLSSADVIWVEEFNNPSGWWGSSNPPTDWTVYSSDPDDENDWHQYSTGPYGNAAYIYYSPIEFPMNDKMYGPYVNCSGYEDVHIDFWLSLEWNPSGVYYGYFYLRGFDGTSNHDIYEVFWPNMVYPGTLLSFDISSWADGHYPVAIFFKIYLSNSQGLWEAAVDHIVIHESDVAVRPNSIGRLRAIYN